MSAEVIHSLGMTSGVGAAVLGVGAALTRARRVRTARRRLTMIVQLVGPGDRRRPTARRRRWPGTSRPAEVGLRLAPVAVVPAGVLLVGGIAGLLVGIGGAVALSRWLRRRRERAADEAAAEPGPVPQLPLAADLLAACLAAGAAPGEAAEAVGRSLPGRIGGRLTGVAAELRLGGEPGRAWGRLAALPGAGRLAVCLERAGTTGVPAVEAVAGIAADCRAERNRAAGVRAGRAQVLTTLPLGLCFLPAFLLTGVVPMVIGLGTA
ncbi:type II secretion system F family protein [Streptomyces pactum]|uniref:Type II secretion system F family protein n=1 Tax=Streptomyces pactum TaxID=68249 RepID=A0ABS0NKP8_9ACTN|nr:type II secretion system F family protein [Streptomyces pactum]MBH5335766.1 type II secretion system F family protein [Streptomyces pactum]